MKSSRQMSFDEVWRHDDLFLESLLMGLTASEANVMADSHFEDLQTKYSADDVDAALALIEGWQADA